MTREIVEGYGGVRAMLDRRRNVELAQAALLRRIERMGMVGGGGSWPTVEKVPGKNEYAFAPRGTNCPEGARQQQQEGHQEALEHYIRANEALISHADAMIDMVQDSVDRSILLDYYCNGLEDSAIARQLHFDRSTVSKRRNGSIFDLECKFHSSPHISHG